MSLSTLSLAFKSMQNQQMKSQQRRLHKDVDPSEMADHIARIAGSDIDYFKKTERISSSRRLERDQILYILW